MMRAMDPLTSFPSAFHAGTTVKYTSRAGSYPATSGWTRTLYLAGANLLSVNGSASGADFTYTLLAADTGKLKAGTYTWRELATKVGDGTYLVDEGTVVVHANIATAGAGDLQSWEERTLAIVEDVLAGRITDDAQAYTIAGRAVTMIPASELMEMRGKLKRAVEAMKRPGKGGPQMRVAFTGTAQE